MKISSGFVFYNYKAHVTHVYDGDSVTLDIDLGMGAWLKGQKVRLAHINAPEIRGQERERGLVSKSRLSELVLGKDVVIQTTKDKRGKYGRWIATVWLFTNDHGWVNINNLLISEGLAEVYM